VKAWQELLAKKNKTTSEETTANKDEQQLQSNDKKSVFEEGTEEEGITGGKESPEEKEESKKEKEWLEEEDDDDEEDKTQLENEFKEGKFSVSSDSQQREQDDILPMPLNTTKNEDEEDENSGFPTKLKIAKNDNNKKEKEEKQKNEKKKKVSRWMIGAPHDEEKPVATSSTLIEEEKEQEEDPLDAFMSSLYNTGEVATQKNLSKITSSLQPIAPTTATTVTTNNKKKGSVVPFAPENDEDDLLEKKIDLYGSNTNTITLEDIMKMSSSTGVGGVAAEGKDKPHQFIRHGWESETEGGTVSPMPNPNYRNNQRNTNPNTNPSNDQKMEVAAAEEEKETEEEREAREEQERKEFVEAIRRAREEEDRRLGKMIEIDEQLLKQEKEKQEKQQQEKEKTKEKEKEKEEELGRIFQGEGDIMDEQEINEKKRTALELLEEAKKGKVLKEIDHNKIEYLPFRKNLYIVPRALAKLTDEQQNQKRDELQIKVRGKGCPSPVDSWEQCGLSDRILTAIYAHSLKEPFAIQRQAIPAIMSGRDVIGVAKTGSGKTLAFLLPMFRHILDQPPLGDNEGPIGLVMAPARELAFQINNEAKKFTKSLGMRVACIYGGSSFADQMGDLKRGSEIVVCTPGRMIDILTMQAGKLVSLKRVTMVVLDEADRMFDMGFEPQIKMILQNIRPDRQTVLFSATFPKQIEKLARSILKFPLEIIVGERSSMNKDITHCVEVHEEEDKFLRLLQLLGVWYEKGSILIFVDKQEKCDQLFQELLKLGYPCLSLHGGKDQVDRDFTLQEFKQGIKTVMIATSVAGRGLDVKEIICVINYNCPSHLEDLIHRIGRTGRAGRKGFAYTFISSKEDQYASMLMRALVKAGQPIPPELEQLSNQFQEKVVRGEAHQIHSGSGFIGKGFKFDASELNQEQKIALLQRKAYEIEEGLVPTEGGERGGEADDEYDYDYLGEEGGGEGGGTGKEKTTAEKEKESTTAATTTSASSSSGQPPAGVIDTRVALERAMMIASQFTKKGGDYFFEELDINDYPIQVRERIDSLFAFCFLVLLIISLSFSLFLSH
jgi:ATP-dependent RNA helicase DDX46/PRP5